MLFSYPSRFFVTIAISCWIVFSVSFANGVDFATELAPALEAKCLKCHNPNILKGDFSMATLEDIFGAGDDFIVPGNSTDSMLHWITLPEEPGERPEMPDEGEPLSEEEARLLAAWIDEGAHWPEGLVLKEPSKSDKSWWAYQPIKTPELDSIDEYIEDSSAEKGLAMNPEADRRTLIRRAIYDLIGLPPTAEEVDRFVNDDDPLAYEKLIERLLASPHYGERWGRHWLDVVRFGESVGFERNTIIDDLWPFRDYVIRSINEDKPFDLFIQEHLAGDIIGRGNPDVEIGSAFLVAGPYDNVNNQDEVQTAQIRANTLDEMINASSEAFLGMTISCARCHDHKFDPILQADYYRVSSIFSGVRHGSAPWATQEAKQERTALLKPLNQRKAELEMELQDLDETVRQRSLEHLADFEVRWPRPSVQRTGTEETFPSIEAKFVRLVCEAQDLTLSVTRGFHIDEFEVWSSEENPQNVALSSNGGIARGEARVNEDFPGTYGAQHTNDGKLGARFISTSNYLTIELAEITEVNRVFFSSARGEQIPEFFKFIFVADYHIEVSLDGENWTEVANGKDRQPVSRKYPNPVRPTLVEAPTHLDHRLIQLGMTKEEQAEGLQIKIKIARLKREIAKVPKLPSAWFGMRNEEDAAGPFHVFIGGSPQKPGKEVVPASLSTLSEVMPGFNLPSESPEAERRLQLAEWIVHPDNPLTSRVLANRLWHYHFGTGIVDTPNDLGYMGGRPTHPELLDFLATELKKNHWQLKAMHRLIMISKTYRQSSQWRADGGKLDSDSRLLWRFPPRRLSAEEIRDSMLSLSGNLDTTMSGAGYRLYHYMQDNVSTYEPLNEHGPETYRRAVYHQNARASVVDLMTDFDQADCTLSTPRRVQTTTPLQALTMMNHQFTLDMAESLAQKVQLGGEKSLAVQVSEIFAAAYQRLPTQDEIDISSDLIKDHGLRALCRAILNSSEFIYLD
jgi:hypothetical protein